jgi:hypothetical protein
MELASYGRTREDNSYKEVITNLIKKELEKHLLMWISDPS